MKIAVLGTGMVGRAQAGKLSEIGHEVVMGTRDVQKSLSSNQAVRNNQTFSEWSKQKPNVKIVTFDQAANHGEIVLEALSGPAALAVLMSLKTDLEGKILIEISNPLDFSSGELRLSVCNDDSLGEQIQKALPDTKVVKAFNTMNASVQIDPAAVAGGDHHLFIAGDDQPAKDRVSQLAAEWYGWTNIIDLGGIKSARGMEMILPIWLNLRQVIGNAQFNFKIAR